MARRCGRGRGRRRRGEKHERDGESSLCRSLFSSFPSSALRASLQTILTSSRQAGRVLEVFAHSGAVVVAHAGQTRRKGGRMKKKRFWRFFLFFFFAGHDKVSFTNEQKGSSSLPSTAAECKSTAKLDGGRREEEAAGRARGARSAKGKRGVLFFSLLPPIALKNSNR